MAVAHEPIDAEVVEERGTDLVVVPDAPASIVAPHNLGGLPYLQDFARLADAICRTEMVPDALRGRADAVLAVVMSGYELGVGPMQALQGINMIKGKPSVSPEMMRALIQQAGHQLRLTATNEQATLRCHRRDWAPDEWDTFTFTMEDAKNAGLTGNDTWRKYPRAMLTARVTAEAARAVFSDVIAGLSYTPDEVEEFAPVPQGLSQPGEVAVLAEAPSAPAPPPPDADEAMTGLTAIIKGVEPETERERLKGHLVSLFGPSKLMTLPQILEASAIASGWPETGPAVETPEQPQHKPGEEPF